MWQCNLPNISLVSICIQVAFQKCDKSYPLSIQQLNCLWGSHQAEEWYLQMVWILRKFYKYFQLCGWEAATLSTNFKEKISEEFLNTEKEFYVWLREYVCLLSGYSSDPFFSCKPFTNQRCYVLVHSCLRWWGTELNMYLLSKPSLNMMRIPVTS